jgi:glucose-6-phosphate dehydrogenase assembly protein OpcA
MNGNGRDFGSKAQVDVAAIEQELRQLWKSASGQDGEPAVIRACSCNVVVLAQNRAEAEAFQPALSAVSEWHPARFLITYREAGTDAGGAASRPAISAWISAHCSLPISGGPQICCESITLAATEAAVEDLANILSSLLVPDLQVFLYWRSFRPADDDLMQSLARFADLLIVDSHASKDHPDGRRRLLEIITDRPAGVSVRDLNWARLTPWRDLLAQFFDAPSVRDQVHDISEVEINRSVAAPGSIPTRTLLLTGWLASRLGWQRAGVERHRDHWTSRWKSPRGDVTVKFTGQPVRTGEAAGIDSVDLHTRSGGMFSVVRRPGSSCITARASGATTGMVHTVPGQDADEATLLVQELSLSGEDVGFQAALAEALALETSFR